MSENEQPVDPTDTEGAFASRTADESNLRADQGAASVPAPASSSVSSVPSSPGAPLTHRVRYEGPPRGLLRADKDGLEIIDAMAGRASVFGFGQNRLIEAIQLAAEEGLGDAFDVQMPSQSDQTVTHVLRDFVARCCDFPMETVTLHSSADLAIEAAIAFARTRGNGTRFRTIAMVGSEHGCTALGRTASGRPELKQGFGPMMAGFAHVPVGDLDALASAIDDQTGCVLICPVELHEAARPVDEDFIMDVRRRCDEHDLLLVIDESRLSFGCTGRPFTFQSIADVTADMVIASAGLFAGLPGGIVVSGRRVAFHKDGNGQGGHGQGGQGGNEQSGGNLPILAAALQETLKLMQEKELLEKVSQSSEEFAVAAAQRIANYEFVRDIHATGMTIGIETDLESSELIRFAAAEGLRVETAGSTAIRIQPPSLISDSDQESLLSRLESTMQSLERAAAELAI